MYYTKEEISEQIAKAKLRIQEDEDRIKLWQSYCKHDFIEECGFAGGSEYVITRECKICGLYEYED